MSAEDRRKIEQNFGAKSVLNISVDQQTEKSQSLRNYQEALNDPNGKKERSETLKCQQKIIGTSQNAQKN